MHGRACFIFSRKQNSIRLRYKYTRGISIRIYFAVNDRAYDFVKFDQRSIRPADGTNGNLKYRFAARIGQPENAGQQV